MTKYQIQKNRLRDLAIHWQASTESLSYGELICWGNYFAKHGKRYGLLTEFKDNGIL